VTVEIHDHGNLPRHWSDSVQPLLQLRGLGISSNLNGRRNVLVSGIDLALAAAETVGIVGESGSGKSMTAKAIIGLLPPGVRASGSVHFKGREILNLPESELAQLRGSEISLLFQDPFTMLNPLLPAGMHVAESLASGNRRAEALRRLAEVGIRDPAVADRYPFQLSGGMRQRVGIASSLARDCKLLIADEPSTALDVTTQKEILALLKSMQEARGMGLILITHNLRVAFAMCDRVYVLYAGMVLEVGSAAALEGEPLHPYSLGLLLSEPPADRRLRQLTAIPGSVPPAGQVLDCCPFASRCEWVEDVCRAGRPPIRQVEAGRWSACVRIDQIREEMATRRREAERRDRHEAGSTASKPVVVTENLEKTFVTGGRVRRENRALGGVSLKIDEAESVGLVGESGSGKTTLARCLVGLETPTSGRITIAGLDASDFGRLSGRDRRRLRHTIQMVFQDPYSTLNPSRTIGATLKEALLVAEPRPRNLEAAARELLARVGVPTGYVVRKPVALSGGERQRVAVARALAVNPRILVCDEPVSALDVSVQAQVLNLFKSLQLELGMTYLFVTHDLAVARQVVDRVYVLYKGEVVETGPVEKVLDHPQHPYTRRLVDSIPRSEEGWLSRPAVQTPGPAPGGPR
jgi:peptide/nickel transport system ATP-binding protein